MTIDLDSRDMMRLSPPRLGFTLLEMLTTVAALVIVLGMMVSLARHVRSASAEELTKTLLRRLDGLMAQYEAHYHQLPGVAPFTVPANVEAAGKERSPLLERLAFENNRQVLTILRAEAGPSGDPFAGLSDTVYDEAVLRDAWGMPLVYMPAMHPAIGTAPQNRRFFFSAGPDRNFLTQEDNLYSYEEGGSALRRLPSPPATTGHAE